MRIGDRPDLNSPNTQSRSRLRGLSTSGNYRKSGGNLLFFVAMDGKSWPPIRAQVLGDIISDSFRAYKNEDFGAFLADLVKVFDQLGSLLKVGAYGDDLTNVVVSCQLHRTDIDLDEVVQKILSWW